MSKTTTKAMKEIRSQITRFEKKVMAATHPQLMMEAAQSRMDLEVMIERHLNAAEKSEAQ